MAANTVGPKRSLFKRPAWAATSTTAITDNNTPIFGQNHLYQEIVEDEKRRRERHAAKQKDLADKKLRKEQERESKRRRISKEAVDSDYGSDDEMRSTRSGSAASRRSQRSATPEQKVKVRTPKSTPRKAKSKLVERLELSHSPRTRSQRAQPASQDLAIVVDDDESPIAPEDEDDDLYEAPRSKSSKRKPRQPDFEPESEEEEDEYLRELKAKARKEAQSKKDSTRRVRETTPGSTERQNSSEAYSPAHVDPKSPTKDANARHSRATSTPATEGEDEVKIWIKTIIPGAKEVIVNRKIGQPLDKVKEFWITRNQLESAIAQRVFFTWNGIRLYNSTTMRGIIERLKKSHPTKDGRDPSDGRIIIEAVTEEIFEYRQKQRANRLAEAENEAHSEEDDDHRHGDSNDNDATGDDDAGPPQPQKTGIVIKLKAQGIDDLSIRVRPNTTIAKILHGFCTLKKVATDEYQDRWLSYDGERLDEEMTVDEAGFEHEDTVEVYLR